MELQTTQSLPVVRGRENMPDAEMVTMWAVALLATVAGLVAYHAMMATGVFGWLS